jgi:hypothetical protein
VKTAIAKFLNQYNAQLDLLDIHMLSCQQCDILDLVSGKWQPLGSGSGCSDTNQEQARS